MASVERIFEYARAVKSGANPRHKQYIMPVTFALSSALFGAAQMIVHSKAIAELLEAGYPILGIASPSDPIFESGPGPSA